MLKKIFKSGDSIASHAASQQSPAEHDTEAPQSWLVDRDVYFT
jgi:hypothetical protein